MWTPPTLRRRWHGNWWKWTWNRRCWWISNWCKYEKTRRHWANGHPKAQSPWVRLMQNLNIRLGNPSQRYYGNDPFRAWAWTDSFTSLQGRDTLALTLPAVEEALRGFDHVALPHLAGLEDVCRHFDEEAPDEKFKMVPSGPNIMWNWMPCFLFRFQSVMMVTLRLWLNTHLWLW